MNNVNNANNAHNACRKCNRTDLNTIENKEGEREGGGETPWHWLCHKVHKLQQQQQQLCLSFPYACRAKSSWPPRQIGITANRQIALIFALRSGKRRSFFQPRKLLHNVRALVSDDFHLGKSQSDASLIRRVRRTVECNFCNMCATLFLTSRKKLLLWL